jgi:UBX domain-containing protein 1
MEGNPAEHDEVVSQFCAMTGTQPSDVRFILTLHQLMLLLRSAACFLQAQQYLAANGWDMEAAVTEFFAEQDEAMQDTNTGGGQQLGAESTAGASGGRTLGGSDVPASSSAAAESSSSARSAAPKKKFATLGDFSQGAAADSSDDDDDNDTDFFAGGEKSGLAVQNPDDLKKKILEKARR